MKSLDTFSWEEEGGWQRRGGLVDWLTSDKGVLYGVQYRAVCCHEWKIERAAEAHYMCHIPMTAISSYYTRSVLVSDIKMHHIYD